jgi:hypothetical protein
MWKARMKDQQVARYSLSRGVRSMTAEEGVDYIA